jgi:hypothetical protein
MAFSVGNLVGIVPVRDAGKVAIVHQASNDYDVDRYEVVVRQKFHESDLFLLVNGKTIRVHERKSINNGRGILYITEYKLYKKSEITVKTQAYRISGGHNMGRVPR